MEKMIMTTKFPLKYQDRILIAEEYVKDQTGKQLSELASDELIYHMLKFSERHVAWSTLCASLNLTKEFEIQSAGQKMTKEEITTAHRMLQAAVAPGLKEDRGRRLSKGFYHLRFRNEEEYEED
jgi:hypothetical protein